MTHKQRGVKPSSAEFFLARLPLNFVRQDLIRQRKARGELVHALANLPDGFGIF